MPRKVRGIENFGKESLEKARRRVHSQISRSNEITKAKF